MMITTHILLGLLLGSFVSSILPLQGLVLFSAFGAFFPDLDMFAEHRKTFHRPFQYLGLSIFLAFGGYFSSHLLLLSLFFLSASVHCFTDILCNGKTMRPWSSKDDRAAFNHLKQKWISPKRLFYDGSLRDLFIALILASVIIWKYSLFLEGSTLLFLSAIYTLSRRRVTVVLSRYERFSEFFKDIW